jgi:C-methyltransferase-like protein/putative zinc binding protein/methyltransferase family protein
MAAAGITLYATSVSGFGEPALRPSKVARAAGSGASVPVECCQVCGHAPLEHVLSLGYMPPVNQMVSVGEPPRQQPWFPTDLLHCPKCELVQLGLAVDPVIIFPPEYPYTSGTTKLLRDNFADLQRESAAMLGLTDKDLVVDIGSNDGTLLSNFKGGGERVLGIEPTDVGDIANSRGIPTLKRYFGVDVAREVKQKYGAAGVVTAANCFAHIEDVHAIVDGIIEMLAPDGVFISESHYLIGLLDTLQYDTVYHEHLRYYSVASLKHLLEMHDLEVFHARPIPSHGGSIRVYAARRGVRPVQESVRRMLANEPRGDAMRKRLVAFSRDVMLSKLRLLSMLRELKEKGSRIVGISAPSRASTMVNYVGLDEGIIDYVCEIAGSLKIGKYMPGTRVPVVEEVKLLADQPECAVIFSWHIADELAPKLRAKGYRGTLITPLPIPRVLA